MGQTKKVKVGPAPAHASDKSESEGEGDVTDYLQSKLAATKKTQFVPHFAQIDEWFQKKNKKFDQLVLKGHNRPITACCFNPVTNDLVTVGKDGAILLFDFASGFKRRLLDAGAPKSKNGHKSELFAVDVSFDGKYLATAGKDRMIKIWDLGTYTKDLATMKKNIAKGDFAIKARHASLVIGHRKLSTEPHVSDAPKSSHSPSPAKGHNHTNGRHHLSPDALAKLHETSEIVNEKVEIYKERHPELTLITTLEGHRDVITGVKFRPGSHELISVSLDRSLKQWDVTHGTVLETLYGHRSDIIDVDSMGSFAISCGFDKTPIVFKLEKETQMMFDEQLFSLDCVRSLNPHFFVTGSQDGAVSFWNVGKKRPLKSFPIYGKNGWASSLCTRYNSDFLISAAVDAPIVVWKIFASDVKKWEFEPKLEIESQGVVTSMAISENCEFLAVVESPENRLGRWTVREKVASKIRLIKIKRHE